MRILIVTPAKSGSNKGNRITADRWGQILSSLGHQVTIAQSYESGCYDLLIALHARRSAKSVSRFRTALPLARIIVALTGTDLHRDLGHSSLVETSLREADRIVLLEPQGGQKLSPAYRRKAHVIYQSSEPIQNPARKLKRFFEVSVLGHLRTVKDPFRTALAARMLPASSRVRVVHLGQALTSQMERRANLEMSLNPRYRWLGAVSHREAQRRLARSHLTVLSSRSEGGPAVLSEAIVNDVPILASKIDATLGILKADHPGLFEFKDTAGLAQLIFKAETDEQFYRRLVKAGAKQKSRFMPSAELKSWKALIRELD